MASEKATGKARTSRSGSARSATQKPAAGGQAAPAQRRKPGATGQGEYYHVEVKPRAQYTVFRTQDVGEKGGLQRVSGRKADGTWETQTWLIAKAMAHVDKTGSLIADHEDASEVFKDLKGQPRRLQGDRFKVRRERKAAAR